MAGGPEYIVDSTNFYVDQYRIIDEYMRIWEGY